MRPPRGRVLVASALSLVAAACTEGVTPDCGTGTACAPLVVLDGGIDASPPDARAEAGRDAEIDAGAGDAG